MIYPDDYTDWQTTRRLFGEAEARDEEARENEKARVAGIHARLRPHRREPDLIWKSPLAIWTTVLTLILAIAALGNWMAG